LQLNVQQEIAAKWSKIAHDIEQAEGKTIPVLAILSVVLGIAAYVGWSIAELAAILGITQAHANDIIELFTQMPAHVANQMCNTFAFDHATDYQSESWKAPGVGRAVGPNDIVWFWDPTLSFATAGTPRIIARGIYGQNQKLILQQPGWGTVPKCQWTFSPFFVRLEGFVRLNATPQPVPAAGAVVKIACQETMTNSDGHYTLEAVPTGNFWARAGWQSPQTGEWWSVQEEVTVPIGGGPHDFVLTPPPVDFREVDMNVSGDADEGSIWAHGYNDIGGASGTIYLGPRGNPADPNDKTGWTGKWSSGGMIYQDTHQVQVDVTANLQSGGSVTGTVTTSLMHDATNVEKTETDNFGPLPPGGSTSLQVALQSGDLTPDHANVTITIYNNQSYGPAQ
jgi:hypothetical protein